MKVGVGLFVKPTAREISFSAENDLRVSPLKIPQAFKKA